MYQDAGTATNSEGDGLGGDISLELAENYVNFIRRMYQPSARNEDLWQAPLDRTVEVSCQRLERMKNAMDTNQFTVLLAAPNTGKTTFMDMFNDYLDGKGENVIFMNMQLGDWETVKFNEEEWSDFCQCWAEKSWDNILRSKSTIYLLLDDIDVVFGSAEKFRSIILRLGDTGGQHVRVLMSATSNLVNTIFPQNVAIVSDEHLQLSLQETRRFWQNYLEEDLPESQLQFLYEITSGRPELLQDIIAECDRKRKTFDGTYKSLMNIMISSDIITFVKKHPAQDLGTYKDEEKEFITEMLMEIDSAGVFVIHEKTRQIMNTIKSLEKHGAICDAEDGVRFSVPLFQMGFAHTLFLPPLRSTKTKHYTFPEVVEHCLRSLEPQQIKKFMEEGTERARRELLVALYAIACQAGFYGNVVPFVGSAFGPDGYSLDIQFNGVARWAFDVMPSSGTTGIPAHITGFINGGIIDSPIKQWAVLHLSHTIPDPSSIEQNHWYSVVPRIIHLDCLYGKVSIMLICGLGAMR